MKILIKNANLISMSESREKIEKNIDIKIDGNKIIEIAPNINEASIDKVIDATNKLAMPGLINTHAHVPMSIFRETVDGYTLQDWLTKKIWPMEDKLTPEDIYNASLLSFIEMIKTGTTTINDMYFMTDEIIKACKETQIRLQTSTTLMGDVDDNGLNRIKKLETLLEKYQGQDELITFNTVIHGLYTSTREYVKKCVEFAKTHNLSIHMHFCENSQELKDIINSYNNKPMEVLEQEFRDIKLILAHCVKLDKNDIARLKELNISVSHCPVSNLKLGCGVADISEMLESGINVTLGTDGQGSGCNLDLFEAMKYTALLQKGITEDAKRLPAYEVLKMATINGAKALSLENAIGSIDIGKCADIIIIDTEDVILNPINDIFSDIVYNAKGNNVNTTIVNGNILMENRKILYDEKDIFDKCKRIIERIKK